jgi:transposase
MGAYSTEQRIFIIEEHIRSSESPQKVRRAFQVKFGDKVGPDRHTISNLVKKFRKTGSVLDDYSQRGRPLNCGVKLWDEIAKDRRS